jgi:hypothetical protein
MTLLKLTQRIREEFQETPGLRVTVDEGARFFLARGRDHRFREAPVQ